LIKHRIHRRAPEHTRKPSLRRLAAYAGISLGAIILAVTALILVFGGAFLNGYGKGKAERAFAAAHPGCVLQIGKLDYSVSANRLVAQSVTVVATNSTLKAGRLSLTGVRWLRLLWGTASLADVLAQASLEVTNLAMEFPQARYGLRCARLRASVPGSELIAEGTELRTLVGDEAFFAARGFRTTRFHLIVPECRVLGLVYDELLQGKSYRARSVHCSRPAFEALVNRDQPVEPFTQRPLMLHEALAVIRQPLQIDNLSITNGSLSYCERVVAGAAPGVLTCGAVNMSIEGIANHGPASAAMVVRAQGQLMKAAAFKLVMTMPVVSPDLSLHYSGTLTAMDLTRFSEFLDIAEHIRIKSGSTEGAEFDVTVAAGQASGRVRAIYKDLEITVLDQQTGSAKGFDNRVVSFVAKVLKIRRSNIPDAADSLREGRVNYTRKPEDEFLQFAWFALRSGIQDLALH
jgi:hypothetical protein